MLKYWGSFKQKLEYVLSFANTCLWNSYDVYRLYLIPKGRMC